MEKHLCDSRWGLPERFCSLGLGWELGYGFIPKVEVTGLFMDGNVKAENKLMQDSTTG